MIASPESDAQKFPAIGAVPGGMRAARSSVTLVP